MSTTEKDGKVRITGDKAVCNPCQGTGLYDGMGERDGLMIVCNSCKGNGYTKINISYTRFTGLINREGVERVISNNPGVVMAPSITKGGVSYAVFLKEPNSPHRFGREVREWYCPAWWYRKRFFDECDQVTSMYKDCPSFSQKQDCWSGFDAMQATCEERVFCEHCNEEAMPNDKICFRCRRPVDGESMVVSK